jgi:hypothetical protein
MLRTNLATRPFYNERAVHIGLGAAAALVLVITLFNVVRLVSLSGRNTDLASSIRRDEQVAVKLEADGRALLGRINEAELAAVVEAAREANVLIDQRTFSWTEFFNLIEATLPADVMLASVHPEVHEGQTQVSMVVVGRRAEDIDQFMEQLEATKAFVDLLPRADDVTEDGLHKVALIGRYLGPMEQPRRAAKPPADSP